MPLIKEIDPAYICSITHDLIKDPVATVDGKVYERFAIEAWLKDHDTSPATGLKLTEKDLKVAEDYLEKKATYCKENNILTLQQFFDLIKDSAIEVLKHLNYFDTYLDAVDESTKLRPLEIALSSNKIEILKLLIKDEADINIVNANGDTLLMQAAADNNLIACQILLEAGVNLSAKNKANKTALDIASEKKYEETEAYLRSKMSNNQAQLVINNASPVFKPSESPALEQPASNIPQSATPVTRLIDNMKKFGLR